MNAKKVSEIAKAERLAFAANLNRIFYASGMSKRAFAKYCGYSPGTMSLWLSGRKLPSSGAAMHLANVFACRPVDFRIPPAEIEIEATLDGLTIHQWRNRALAAERKIVIDEIFEEGDNCLR